jgi:pilus assembly protein CpaC
MRQQKARIAAACGVQLFIIGVLGPHLALAQTPDPLVAAVRPVPAALSGGAPATVEAEWTGSPTEIRLLVGRSTLLDVGTPIARVSLTSSDVADALVTTPNQLLVHGKEPGSISMFVWDRSGAITRYEIAVQRDLDRLSQQMAQLFPGERIEVHSNGSHVVLSGRVTTPDVAEKAISVAAGYVDSREDVVTLLQVEQGPVTNQVLLRVRFAEVSRSALSEFGASFFTSPTGVKNNVARLSTQQYSAPNFSDLAWTKADGDFGSPVTSAEGKFDFSDFLNLFLLNERYDLGVLIKALQNRGLFQSLAEPNLVAESGKEASFLAGGEFPIPVAQGSGANMAVSVQFKEFGVRLSFTPTVNGDRVHLKVRPEVSTLDYGNAVILNGFRIPSLSTRRTETELELRDGQTFAIAGLINNQMQSTLQKIPGIGDIPILGHLFRSKAAQRDQTELVVMITPEILRSDSPGVTPDLPSYPETFLPEVSEGLHPAPPAAFTSRRLSGGDDIATTTTGADSLEALLGPPPAEVHIDPSLEALLGPPPVDTYLESASVHTIIGSPPPMVAPAAPLVDEVQVVTVNQARLDAAARDQARRDAKAAEQARKDMERQDRETAALRANADPQVELAQP